MVVWDVLGRAAPAPAAGAAAAAVGTGLLFDVGTSLAATGGRAVFGPDTGTAAARGGVVGGGVDAAEDEEEGKEGGVEAEKTEGEVALCDVNADAERGCWCWYCWSWWSALLLLYRRVLRAVTYTLDRLKKEKKRKRLTQWGTTSNPDTHLSSLRLRHRYSKHDTCALSDFLS
jgi:hypothetical protein